MRQRIRFQRISHNSYIFPFYLKSPPHSYTQPRRHATVLSPLLQEPSRPLTLLALTTPMADCYASEANDFHRRWLPREIFADIGIVDTEPLDAIIVELEEGADVAKLTVQLVGIIKAGRNKGKSAPRDPSPPPLAPAIYAPCHFAAPVSGDSMLWRFRSLQFAFSLCGCMTESQHVSYLVGLRS
jgi:hypothetical protein